MITSWASTNARRTLPRKIAFNTTSGCTEVPSGYVLGWLRTGENMF